MPLLRLTQNTLSKNHHRVEIRYESEPPIPVEFDFEMDAKDSSQMRWYLEEFLQYPMDPAPQIAREVEARMRAIGVELFEKIINSRDAIKLWGRLQTAGLRNARVEILSSVQDAVSIPWELLCDPDTATPLALEAQSFVRAPVSPARLPQPPQGSADKVRILLVICRPGQDQDVPFRSVAGKLARGWTQPPPSASRWTCCARQPLRSLPTPCARPKPPGSPTTSFISTSTARISNCATPKLPSARCADRCRS